MISVAEARARILATAKTLPAEWVPLETATGRALATPLVAMRTQPPADMSAMDGYALRAADIAAVPARLAVIGTAAAGHPFAGTVNGGEAVRIFTGAPAPEGADTVVIQENTEASSADQVLIRETAARGRNIRKAGSDFAQGAIVLDVGRRLDAPSIALAAAAGHTALPACRPPRVAILATGDELVPPGRPTMAGQIISSNGVGLAALVRAAGGEPIDLGIAPDRPEALRAAIRSAKDVDVLVTIGGASVGDHDLVRPALEAEGVAIDFWKIAMRPGKPLMFGTRPDGLLALGLPGNPVSALVCALLFLRPLLLALQGLPTALPEGRAQLGGPISANDRRADFLRARLTPGTDGLPLATAFQTQDSGMLQVLAAADALICREPQAPAAPAGTVLPIIPLAGLW
jgi:molybdopterin molybdotransferase